MSEMAYAPLLRALRERAAFATVSQLGPRRRPLADHLEQTLGQTPGAPGALLAPPVFEALFDWEKHSQTLAQLADTGQLHRGLVEAMDRAPGEQRFDKTWLPHKHQAKAWARLGRDAQGQRKRDSVLVSTGTASGKTECFLVPILDDLAREADRRGTLQGVRALFLYPLNALINSQEERLSAWTAGLGGKVRFALYNGNTPEQPTGSRHDSKVSDRKTIRANPPPILVTNTTMLEYVLVRQEDAPIREASRGTLRWIVLDEAHTHLGAQAAELALLLRRVMAAFHVTADEVRFVATSATIGSQEDTAALQQFLADLAGVAPERIHVITGSRALPSLPPATDDTPITPARIAEWEALARAGLDTDLYTALCSSKPAWRAREALNEKPWRADALGRALLDDLPLDETLRFLDLASGARRGRDWFLPLRGHLFHRTQKGLWACLNPRCDRKSAWLAGDDPGEEGWPYGQVYLSRQVSCGCGGAVFPLVHCNTCGETYLSGSLLGERDLYPQEWRGVIGADDEDEAEDGDETDAPSEAPPRRRATLLIAAHAVPGGRPPARRLAGGEEPLVDAPISVTVTGALTSGDDPPPALRLFPLGRDDEHAPLVCVTCQDGERKDFDLFRSPWLGAPFYLRTAIPLLLERQPPMPGAENAPLAGRRLVTFTDSRQGSAGFAGSMLFEAERNWVRSQVYHRVWSAWLSGSSTRRDQLDRDVAELREAAKASPFLMRQLQDKQRELDDLQPKPLSWKAMRKALETEELERFKDHLKAQFGALDIDLKDYAHGALLREFARRPRRQNSLETLGLVRLTYPNLESVTTPPTDWRGPLADWRDFLAFALDYFVRAHTALVGSSSDQRWLGGRISFNAIVDDKGQTKKNRTYRWPGFNEDGRSTRPHRLERVLAAALDLDSGQTEHRSKLQSLCRAAFKHLKDAQILSKGEDGYQLNLAEQGAFAPVLRGWRCPITRRILDKTLRGVSPYMRWQQMRKDQCQRVDLPRPTQPFGDPDEIRAWLETPPFQALRAQGLWTELSDRIALRTPLFLSGEHSAQQPAQRLRALESQFKSGKVNLLSCSTTMEMGVDIGGLNAVTMNNAPPGPANFLQRAGRAGRRDANRAVSLTLCKADPHGRMVFRNPLWPFTTPVAVPRVALDSARIVQRHVNALAFGAWLATQDVQATKLEAGWLLWPEGERPARAEALCAWLRDPARLADKLSEDLTRLVDGSALAGRSPEALLDSAAEALDQVSKAWRVSAEVLHQQLVDLGGAIHRDEPWGGIDPARRALHLQWRRVVEAYLLGTLCDTGFLPAHGFPTGVLPFVHLTAELLKDERLRVRRAKEDGLQEEPGRRRQFASRDLPMAIREYAPGNAVILDGWRYPVGGLTLNWKIPQSEAAVSEVQDLRMAWSCAACGASGVEHRAPAACPRCGAAWGKSKPFEVLRPGGFAVDLSARADRNFGEKQYVAPIPPRISAGDAPWEPLPEPRCGRSRHDPEGRLFFYSEGTHRAGFALCLACGRAASEAPADPEAGPALDDRPPFDDAAGLHWRLRGGGKGKGQQSQHCEGSSQGERSFKVRRHLRLGAEWRTDVFELELRDDQGAWITDESTCLSLAVALRAALAAVIGVEARELGYATRRGEEAGETTRAVVLYDRAEGGAGFVAQARGQLRAVLEAARRLLECEAQGDPCDRACERCLLDYETQHDAALLDRVRALSALQWAERGLGR